MEKKLKYRIKSEIGESGRGGCAGVRGAENQHRKPHIAIEMGKW